MKNRDLLLVFILSLLVLSPDLLAQTTAAPADASFKVPIAQPSPDAASLGRYGEYPVSMNNGLVNISIPLYEINTGKLSLPISLTYHAGGVKAYDIASSAGLGWSLNAGGAITRAVLGKPDESTVGVLNKPFPNPDIPGEHFSCFLGNLTNVSAFDGQVDKFFYNLGGSNGKFIFKNIKATGTPWEIVTIPYSPVKISISPDFETFTIIDLDGATYVFGQMETTRVDADGSFHSDAPTSWFLTSMVSVDKSDTIALTYTAPIQIRTVQTSNTLTERDDYMYNLSSRITESKSATVNVTNAVNINEITFNNGKLSFEYGNREDLTGKKLISIKIFQKNNGQYSEIKRFNFAQTYFTATPGQTSLVEDLGFIFDKRLRLDSVYEQGFLNGLPGMEKPPYIFEYETGSFPLYASTAQDLFGFYNGKHSNVNLLFYGVGNTADGPKLSMEFGANRSVDPGFIKAGLLKKITFPTGGYTFFEFEPNQKNYNETVSEPNYTSFPYSLTSHDLVTTEKIIEVTSEKTGGAEFITAQFKVNFINDRFGPTISSTVKLFDQTKNSYAKFSDSDTDAVFDLPSTTPFLDQIRDVKLFLNHTYKLSYDKTGISSETPNFLYTEVNWKLFTGMSTFTINKTDYTGGLRTKSITSYDGNGKTIRKKYEYPVSYYNSNLFNGDLSRMANFFRTRTRRFWNPSPTNPLTGDYPWYNVYGENITFQIGSSSNTVLSYEKVEEYSLDSQENPLGKTVYTYNKAQDAIPSLAPYFRTDEEWKRSQLANQKIYKSAPGGKFVLLKEVINAYDYTQMEAVKSYYAALEQDFTGTSINPFFKECPQTLSNNVYKWMDYDQYVYKSNLISTNTIQYDENGLNPQTTQTQYEYDEGKHKQVIRTTQETSKPEMLVTDIKYPLDYTIGNCDLSACFITYNNSINDLLTQKNNCEIQYYSQYKSYVTQGSNAEAETAFNNYLNCNSVYQSSVTQNAVPQLNSCKTDYNNCVSSILNGSTPAKDKALLMMQRDNVVNRVVENRSGFLLNGSEYVTDGIKTDFKPIANEAIGPEIIWKFNSFNPVARATFDQTPTAYYKKLGSYLRYDDANNIIEKAKENDIPSAFIWDYNKQYPIAEVTNARAQDIAYTSFEADGNGNFTISSSIRNTTDSRTGKRSYNLSNGNISKSGLITGGKYTISFWAKSGTISLNTVSLVPSSATIINGWQYYETFITGSSSVTIATLSGSATIDELRFFPSDSRMTTYTFDPIIGMTSSTDMNNLTTYYEYDALNRLSLVRDRDRNIIKRISYQYKQD